MTYRLLYAPSVAKDLRALPEPERIRIVDRITALANDPRPPGMESLKGRLRGLSRVRVGNYRIAYRIETEAVRILKVDKRGRVYKRM